MKKNLAPISMVKVKLAVSAFHMHAFVSRLYFAYALKDFKILWHKCLSYLDDMSHERSMTLSIILLLGFANKFEKHLKMKGHLDKFLETGQMS